MALRRAAESSFLGGRAQCLRESTVLAKPEGGISQEKLRVVGLTKAEMELIERTRRLPAQV